MNNIKSNRSIYRSYRLFIFKEGFMKSILFLTQDQKYCSKLTLFREAEEYDLVICATELQVQDYIATKNAPHMIIIDEEGVTNLEELTLYLKKTIPQTLRLILTAADYHDIFDCSASSECRIVYQKKMKQDYLWEVIERLIKLNEKINSREILELMASLEHIPTLPNMFFKLNQMIKEQASIEEIAREIERDPAIASNVLKLANTAFYNAKTGSIRQAMMYIGLNNIKNIILTNAVFGADGLSNEIRDIHWEHAQKTNMILNAIYKELLNKRLDNQFSAVGLLHDIGAIVLMKNYPQKFDALIKEVVKNKALQYREEEAKTFKITHEVIGGYLLELWGLPLPMVEATLMHHEPLSTDLFYRELVCAVHLANYASWRIMDYPKHLDRGVFSILGIEESSFEAFLETILKD